MDEQTLRKRLGDGHPLINMDTGEDLPECPRMFGGWWTKPYDWTGVAMITAHYRCPDCGTEWRTDWNRDYVEHGFDPDRPPSDGVSTDLEIADDGTITEVDRDPDDL